MYCVYAPALSIKNCPTAIMLTLVIDTVTCPIISDVIAVSILYACMCFINTFSIRCLLNTMTSFFFLVSSFSWWLYYTCAFRSNRKTKHEIDNKSAYNIYTLGKKRNYKIKQTSRLLIVSSIFLSAVCKNLAE